CALACSVAAGTLWICASEGILQKALKPIIRTAGVRKNDSLLAAQKRGGIGIFSDLTRILIVLRSRRCR
ncbi:MAG: hypothetical protein M3O06_02165, partial [Pseudomonadota bacterium]|nr:hypothetical protein [Pseudomonadota bacterium]